VLAAGPEVRKEPAEELTVVLEGVREDSLSLEGDGGVVAGGVDVVLHPHEAGVGELHVVGTLRQVALFAPGLLVAEVEVVLLRVLLADGPAEGVRDALQAVVLEAAEALGGGGREAQGHGAQHQQAGEAELHDGCEVGRRWYTGV